MKQKWIVLLTVVLFVVLLGGAYLLYQTLGEKVEAEQLMTQPQQDSTNPSKEENRQEERSETAAPDFTAYDGTGKEVQLSAFKGKPVVLNFWASWCGPCQMEMPEFQNMYETMGQEIQFLMVNMTGGRETLDSAKAFIEKAGYTFPVFYDTQGSASAAYGVSVLPITYFIDKDGYLIAQAAGAIDRTILMKGIGMITK